MVKALWFSLLFILFLAGSVDAATPPPVSDCGLYQDKIRPGDGTLCKDDIAFGVMYEMFPSVFKEIGPLWNLTAFSQLGDGFEQQDLLGQYHGDTVFVLLYNLFRNLVILCALTYLVFLAIDVGGRLIRGKSLSDDDPGKDNNKSWATGGIIGVIFILPYKQLFIGPIIVFSFAVASLSTANFFLSLFLSSQSQMLEATENQERLNNSPHIAERHDYIANSLYRYLIGMKLCQKQSAAYVMTKAGLSAADPSQYRTWQQCAEGSNSSYRVIGKPNNGIGPTFVNIYEDYHSSPIDGNVLLSEASSIEFMSDWRDSAQCGDLGLLSNTFYCGSIRIYEPDWGSSPLLDLMPQSSTLLNSLDSLASSLTAQTSPGDVESIVFDHWIRFYETIREELFNSIESIQVDGADLQQSAIEERRRSATKQLLLDQNGHAFRQLARFYHQSAQNILAFGRSTSYRETGYETDPVNGARTVRVPVRLTGAGQNMRNLFLRLEEAGSLASFIERSQCLEDVRTLFQAQKTLDYLSESTPTLQSDAHARCVDFANMVVKELNEATPFLGDEELPDYQSERLTAIEDEFLQEMNRVVNQYAKQRRAIENSFKRYIKEYDTGGALNKMRQQGYLAIAGFTYHMTGRFESIKKETKMMVNHLEMRQPGYDSRYIGSGLHEDAEQDTVFSPYIQGDSVFKLSSIENKPIDPLVDRYFWLVQQSMLLRQPTLTRDGDWSFTRVLDNMTLPITGLSRLGMDIKGDKDWRLCPEDPAKCPFPVTDPMLELTLMGHDMVDAGVAFYTLAIGMQGIGSLAAQSSKSDFKGSVTKRSRTSGVKMGGGATASLLKDLGGLSQLMFSIMGTLLLIYIAVGAILAYLLPLMPFIFIYMGFITWVMVVVMASFSILLWSFFWIRFREKRDMLREAGFHYGVDLLFKPTFNLLAVLFAWAMFYVLMFILGMSSGWMTTLPLSGEGAFGLRQILDPLFILLFVGFIYAMALKFSYNVMDEMSGELLAKLGVKNKSVKDSVGNMIKALLYDKVMEKGRQFNAKLDGSENARKEQEKAMKNMADIQAAQANAQAARQLSGDKG